MTIKDGVYIIVILILVVYGYFRVGSVSEARLKEKAAQAKIKRLDGQLDSLTERLHESDLAIERADLIILSYKSEIVRAQSISRETRNTHEETNFTVQPSDSVRIRKLANHFPSILSH